VKTEANRRRVTAARSEFRFSVCLLVKVLFSIPTINLLLALLRGKQIYIKMHQLLYSSTMSVVEFASVSFLRKDSSELGESIVMASPLSTTPFSSSMALKELHEYLLSNIVQQDSTTPLSCVDHLAADDLGRDRTPQMFRSDVLGIGMYYWLIREPAFIQQAFLVVKVLTGRCKTDQVAGVVISAGLYNLFSMQPACLPTRPFHDVPCLRGCKML
jgi:hypothetical protein